MDPLISINCFVHVDDSLNWPLIENAYCKFAKVSKAFTNCKILMFVIQKNDDFDEFLNFCEYFDRFKAIRRVNVLPNFFPFVQFKVLFQIRINLTLMKLLEDGRDISFHLLQ